MITRVNYITNGMGETIYIPQYKNFLSVWVTFREWIYYDSRQKVKRKSLLEAEEIIKERFESSLRKVKAVVGVVENEG